MSDSSFQTFSQIVVVSVKWRHYRILQCGSWNCIRRNSCCTHSIVVYTALCMYYFEFRAAIV